jgi:tRNA pseudouridine55 synthase
VAKPAGPTSHDVVAAVRRALGGARTGHLGTLDPFADGVLVVVVGRATRLAQFAAAWPKTYAGVLRLGVTTDSDDRTGTTVMTSDARASGGRRVGGAWRGSATFAQRAGVLGSVEVGASAPPPRAARGRRWRPRRGR